MIENRWVIAVAMNKMNQEGEKLLRNRLRALATTYMSRLHTDKMKLRNFGEG